MIERLYLRELVTFDEVELEFNKGLVVLTGPSGAGKSVLMSAILSSFGYTTQGSASLCEVNLIKPVGLQSDAYEIEDDLTIKTLKKEKLRYFIEGQNISKKALAELFSPYVKYLSVRDKGGFDSESLLEMIDNSLVAKDKNYKKSLKEYKKRYTFNRSEKGEMLRYIALKGVSQNHPEAAHWLEKVDEEWRNDQVNQAKLKMALIAEDWKKVITLSQDLVVKDEENQYQWQYWWARALEQLEQTDEAEKRFRILSQYRDYYGFSAANRINKPYSFQQQPLNVSKRLIAKVKKNAGLVRARELYFVGWPAFARSEWHKAQSTLNQNELKAAVAIAHEMGWHDQAIFTAHKAKVYNDLKIRFPLPFYDPVFTHAKAQQLDSAYIYAVIRQESAFQTDVRSGAGALGLMQLMPATAREVARKQKIRLKSTQKILVPDTNIQLGSAYLRQMLNRFDDNHLLATAAYNAGPTRAKRWSKPQSVYGLG